MLDKDKKGLLKTNALAYLASLWAAKKRPKCEKGQNGKMTKWQNDRMTKWQNDKMTKWQNDKMTKWQNDKMTKWQNDTINRIRIANFKVLEILPLGTNVSVAPFRYFVIVLDILLYYYLLFWLAFFALFTVFCKTLFLSA
jgi:hypothetical protein